MINKIKNKLKRTWGWIKNKVKKLKKWIIALLIPVALAAPLVMYPVGHITAPENNGYNIGVLNYDAVLAKDITADQPLKYQLDDKYISFKPVEIRWDKSSFKTIKPKQAKISDKKYLYEDAFGYGIDIDMNFGERVFEKIVKIDSLSDLGVIPIGVKNLEIVFEVDTNFVIDGWNKMGEFKIIDKIRLGDYSYLEQPQAWDSYIEEVCQMKDEDLCDVGCINDEKCDICEVFEFCETKMNIINIESYLKRDGGKLYLIKKIPIDWLKDAQYPIYTDADVTYGTESEFDSSTIGQLEVVKLDTNKLVVCYADHGNSDGECRVATISGTTFTWGTMATFDTDIVVALGAVGACAVDTDQFAVVYADDGSSDDGYTEFATVSTRAITYNDTQEYLTIDPMNQSCAKLDTDKWIIGFIEESGQDAEAVACTYAASNITCGSASAMDTSSATYNRVRVCQSGTDKFSVIFEDSGNDVKIRANTASGNSIQSWGTVVEVDGGNADPGDCDFIETDKNLFVWDDVTLTQGESRICTLSGTTFTCGTMATFDTNASTHLRDGISIDTTHFLLTFFDTTPDDGISIYSSFSGRTITQGSEETFTTKTVNGLSMALIDTGKVVICFPDLADGSAGSCIIGDIAAEEEARRIIIIE